MAQVGRKLFFPQLKRPLWLRMTFTMNNCTKFENMMILNRKMIFKNNVLIIKEYFLKKKNIIKVDLYPKIGGSGLWKSPDYLQIKKKLCIGLIKLIFWVSYSIFVLYSIFIKNNGQSIYWIKTIFMSTLLKIFNYSLNCFQTFVY